MSFTHSWGDQSQPTTYITSSNSNTYGAWQYYGTYPVVPQSKSTCSICGTDYTSGLIHTCPAVLNMRVTSLENEVKELHNVLKILSELVHNKQDEEVRGHSEDGCESPDSRGVPGVSIETVPSPRGDWRWPPKS